MEKKNIVDSLVGIIKETEEQDKMLQSQNAGWRKELRERLDWTQNTTIKGKFELEKFIQQLLDKAREEGFDSGVEKTVNIIQEGLDELLLEKDGEKYWVGDILRDCGSSVEKILPQNMKHYLLSKLNNK